MPENFEDRVKASLDNIRYILAADGGDVELVSVDDNGKVTVKLTGACGGCPMGQMTLKRVIEEQLRGEIPEITSVEGIFEGA